MDAPIPPGRVLPGQSQHQPAELRPNTRAATLVRVGPAVPDQVTCQRSSVVGCTNKPRHTGRGSSRTSPASSARSAQSSRGLVTWRWSTATSWRNTSSSASLAAELLASSASHRNTWQTSR